MTRMGTLLLFLIWALLWFCKIKRGWALDGAKFVLVNEGLYELVIFNFCFLCIMIASALIIMSEKKFPIIDFKERKEGWSNWGTFFFQPFIFSGDHLKLEVCMKRTGYLQPNFLSPYILNELATWCKIYNDLIEFKPEIKEYMMNIKNWLPTNEYWEYLSIIPIMQR